MTRTYDLFRSVVRRLGPFMAVLLLALVVVGGVHRHESGDSRHDCAVCSASHAPAVAGATTPAPGPVHAWHERAFIARVELRVVDPAAPRTSRAPPSA